MTVALCVLAFLALAFVFWCGYRRGLEVAADGYLIGAMKEVGREMDEILARRRSAVASALEKERASFDAKTAELVAAADRGNGGSSAFTYTETTTSTQVKPARPAKRRKKKT